MTSKEFTDLAYETSGLGKVAMFRGGDPIAKLVCIQSRSIYSHAAILIPGTQQVLESYPFAGVRIRTLKLAEARRVDVFNVRGMTREQWELVILFAKSQIGQGYDWHSVLRFLNKIPARENSRWFCSELVHKSIAMAGVRIVARTPSSEVSPADLAQSPLLEPWGVVPRNHVQGLVDSLTPA